MAKLLTAATPISYYLVVVNIVAFILYGTDKAKAMHHQWRIKEAVLIGIAFVGGAFGAFAGMIVFHHKTRKMKFRILVPIAIIIWLTFGGFLAGRDVVGLAAPPAHGQGDGVRRQTGQRMNITAQRSHRIIAVWIKMVTVRMIRPIF